MKFTCCNATVGLILGLVVIGSSRADGAPRNKRIVPDPAMQAKLASVIEAKSTREMMVKLGNFSDWLVQEQIEEEEYFEQLIIYSADHNPLTWGLSVFGPPTLRVAPSEMVKVVAPLLNMNEPRSDLQRILRDVLSYVDQTEEGECPIFEHYEDILSGPSPPRELARYMFQVRPHYALYSMVRVQKPAKSEIKKIVAQERLIDDSLWKRKYDFLDYGEVTPEAAAALQELAKRDEWWVQLYVIAIMERHEAFRDEQIVESLAKSQHEIVRRTAKSLPGFGRSGAPLIRRR